MLRARMVGLVSQSLNEYNWSVVGFLSHDANSTFRASPHPEDCTVVRCTANGGLYRSRSIARDCQCGRTSIPV